MGIKGTREHPVNPISLLKRLEKQFRRDAIRYNHKGLRDFADGIRHSADQLKENGWDEKTKGIND